MARCGAGAVGIPVMTWLLSALLLTSATGCALDRRPDERSARRIFSALYPGTVIDTVRISEDEATARSFMFSYHRAGGPHRTIEIRFMEGSSGLWGPSPPAPDSLP